MESTNKTLIQEFHTSFQAAQTGLLARLDALKIIGTPPRDDVNALASDIAKLRKNLSDALGYLPAYDHRQYEQTLKSLEQSLEELRVSSTGKPKFAFKRKTQKPAPTTPPVPVAQSQHQDISSIPNDVPRASASVTLSSCTNQHLSWSTVPSMALPTTDLSISGLDRCVVNLLDNPEKTQPLTFTALHIRNVTNSLLLLPLIQGSAMIHDMSNCVIVLGCHQFRMHTSSQVNIYLSIDSNPIIEHCSKLRFGHYPATLRQTSVSSSAQPNDKMNVQDFSHIRATPSPNWTMLEPGDELSSQAWQEAVVMANAEEADEILKKLLPQRDA